jgi:hypothetical protein
LCLPCNKATKGCTHEVVGCGAKLATKEGAAGVADAGVNIYHQLGDSLCPLDRLHCTGWYGWCWRVHILCGQQHNCRGVASTL